MAPNSELEYRELVTRYREIRQRFEMATTMEDRKAALEDMKQLSDEALFLLGRKGQVDLSRA